MSDYVWGSDLIGRRLVAGENVILSSGSDTLTVSASSGSTPFGGAGADVASAGAAGSAATVSRSDHAHRGVTYIQASGSAPIYGGATLAAGMNIDLSQSGQVITISGGSTPLTSFAPADVAGAAVVGTSGSAARGDHAHRGVTSLATGGSQPIYGAAVLTPGANISLTQSSGSIAISATSSGSGGGTPSNTVVSETAYGNSSTAGVSSEYSRGDHTHGTPALGALRSVPAAATVTLTAGYSLSIVSDFEIGTDGVLELADDSILEIT